MYSIESAAATLASIMRPPALLISLILLGLAIVHVAAAAVAGVPVAALKSAAWPANVQPFFLSALSNALTDEQAAYIARFPVAVINHKQSLQDAPRNLNEEPKQLAAIAAIKRANASCKTFFYLNSQNDLAALNLHKEFAAAGGAWWLKDDDGGYVWENKTAESGPDYTFDFTVSAAREAWVSAALAALNNTHVDGIFVDSAKNVSFKHVAPQRMAAWNEGHVAMTDELRKRSSRTKLIVLNNQLDGQGMGQLFERWGESPDHDNLTILEDIARMQDYSSKGLVSFARSGGVKPGTGDKPDAQTCAAGLAQMLCAVQTPGSTFFSCAVDFRGSHWMTLLDEPIYNLPLGAPMAASATRHPTSGLLTRAFSSGTVAIIDPTVPHKGCVKWAGGTTTGKCP